MQNIVWKVADLKLRFASTRIRTLLPAMALARAGYRVTVTDTGVDDDSLTQADVVIINKSFGDADLALAEAAKRHGIPVIFDLCDNVFSPNYGDRSGKEAARTRAILESCTAITTTGSELSEAIREHSGFNKQIAIVPDGEEPLNEIRALRTKLSGADNGEGSLAYLSLRSRHQLTAERHIEPDGAIRSGFRTLFKKDKWLKKELRTVLWFGAPGRQGDLNGIYSIRSVKDALEAVNRDIPLQLLVVSGSRQLFHACTDDFAIHRVYRPWSLMGMYDVFKNADVTIVPNPKDEFSIVKSANRTLFSLAQNTPVVADLVPSLEEFKGCTILDNWEDGLRVYLGDSDLVSKDLKTAQSVIAQHYSMDRIRDRWIKVLHSVTR